MMISPKTRATPSTPERPAVLNVRNDRAAAGENEGEGRRSPRREARRASLRPGHSRHDLAQEGRTRSSISSRIRRTVSRSFPPDPRAPSPRSACRGRSGRRPAAHRDHRVRRSHEIVGERLRELPREVDPDLGHRRDRGRVDLSLLDRSPRYGHGPGHRRASPAGPPQSGCAPRCVRRRREPRGRPW